MNNWLKYPIAENQFPQIVNLAGTKTKRIAQYLTILQIVYQSRRLSAGFAADLHRETKRKKVSLSTMRRRIQELLDYGIIIVAEPGNRKEHIPPFYTFSPDQISLILASKKGFFTKAEYSRRTNPIILHQYQHPAYAKHSLIRPSWANVSQNFELLPDNEFEIQFMLGIDDLTSRHLRFLKTPSLITNQNPNRRKSIVSLPDRDFKIDYRILRTGRIQSQPHVFRGNTVTKFIRPAHDPLLERGITFYLDYSTQEIRLLANLTQDLRLLHLLKTETDLNRWFREDAFGGISDSLSKKYRSAWSYGCEGGSLKSVTQDYLSSINSNQHPYFFAKSRMDRLNHEFPTVPVYRSLLAEKWLSDGRLINRSGIIRLLDQDVRNKNGKVSEEKVIHKCLSHMVQGDGAWITRRIIANAPQLEVAELILPVHDGFIFYCPINHIAEGLKETQILLTTAAREVSKVPIPFILEWAMNNTGYITPEILEYMDRSTVTAINSSPIHRDHRSDNPSEIAECLCS